MSLLNTSSNSKTLHLHDWNAMVSFTKTTITVIHVLLTLNYEASL